MNACALARAARMLGRAAAAAGDVRAAALYEAAAAEHDRRHNRHLMAAWRDAVTAAAVAQQRQRRN